MESICVYSNLSVNTAVLWRPQRFAREHSWTNSFSVVEKFKAWLGYEKISEALNTSWSTVQSITWKCKEYGTTANLPRHGRQPKLTGRARRALIREAAKRPMITLEELQRSTDQVEESVHRTTVSHALHKSGLYGRVARRQPLFKHENCCSQTLSIQSD